MTQHTGINNLAGLLGGLADVLETMVPFSGLNLTDNGPIVGFKGEDYTDDSGPARKRADQLSIGDHVVQPDGTSAEVVGLSAVDGDLIEVQFEDFSVVEVWKNVIFEVSE